MKFMGKHPIRNAIAICIIISIAAYFIDITKTVAAVQAVLLLKTVIMEFTIAADLKRRVEQNLRLIMIPVSVDFRFGPTRGSYSENMYSRSVPLHKLLLWAIPALYLVCFICSIMI